MAAATLLPTGIGAYDEWGLVGASKVAATNSDDADTSYITGDAVSHTRQRFTFADVPTDADDPVTTAVVKAKVRGETPSSLRKVYIYQGSSEILVVTNPPTSYTEYSTDFYSLVKANINAGQIGLFVLGGSADVTRCTYLHCDITYTVTPAAAGGGFGFFFSWLLPVLGAGLTLADMERAIAGRQFREPYRVHRLSRTEVVPLYHEWQAWRRPVQVDLGSV